MMTYDYCRKLLDIYLKEVKNDSDDPTLDDSCVDAFFDWLLQHTLIQAEEVSVLKNRLKAEISIYQPEGAAILSNDYSHDPDWYNKLQAEDGYSEFYWERYRKHLLEDKHFPIKVVNTLGKSTLNDLMSYIGNPRAESAFSRRGLVVGDIQSGKTSNYIGLMTKAADAGYKVIILLTGTIESLRRQTQIRVEEGFIGFDTETSTHVGVGLTAQKRMPHSMTSRARDYQPDNTTALKIDSDDPEPLVFVCKKNVSVLKRLYRKIKALNTNNGLSSKITAPLLLIDDEADNASINTKKEDDDPTATNKIIRQILELFSRNTYVGFTATPFANVFISYTTKDEMLGDDLFPRDFIYALEAPSNYCGLKQYFGDENKNFVPINDEDESLFPMDHKKDFEVGRMFGSFYESINSFLLVNAIRDLCDEKTNTHRSMLVNMSRFQNVQKQIAEHIEEYVDKIRDSLKWSYNNPYSENTNVKSLRHTFEEEFSDCGKSWEEVFKKLPESIKNVKVYVVNSSKNSIKLDYSADNAARAGLRVIAVGGLALSRGLTLEGLCVSYFYRNTATYDVLMQMGRWFGYRDGYADLCRIYMTRQTRSYYLEVAEAIQGLKADIRLMGEQGKTPVDYGIRVIESDILDITAASKMRSASSVNPNKTFSGNYFEAPFLSYNLDINEQNVRYTMDFLNVIPAGARDNTIDHHPYFRNIPKKNIIDLLDRINIHEANQQKFDKSQLTQYIKTEYCNDNFDIEVVTGSSNSEFTIDSLGYSGNCLERTFDVVNRKAYDDLIIRMEGPRTRLGGTSDTKFGLTQEQIDECHKISSKPREQDYLIEGRNPLLIVYFVRPKCPECKNGITDETFNAEGGLDEAVDKCSLITRLDVCKHNYLVSYCLAFPRSANSAIPSGSLVYKVNRTCNYFEIQPQEDEELYGEEYDE